MYYCSSCGSELDNDAVFCTNCGARNDNVFGSDPVDPIGNDYYEQYPNEQGYYTDPYETNTGSKNFAIISLVAGILSIPCSVGICVGMIPSVAAIVLGLISFKKQENATGMAMAGIICGGVGIMISMVVLIIRIVQGI